MLRSYYDGLQRSVSLACAFVNVGESETVQSEKESADINLIVKRFGVTGLIPESVRTPLLEDFDAVVDFRTAMNVAREATESFMQLDAVTRKRFGNDPQAFLEFCSDVKNIDEMRKIGLAIPEKMVEPEPPPMRVEVVNVKSAEKDDK